MWHKTEDKMCVWRSWNFHVGCFYWWYGMDGAWGRSTRLSSWCNKPMPNMRIRPRVAHSTHTSARLFAYTLSIRKQSVAVHAVWRWPVCTVWGNMPRVDQTVGHRQNLNRRNTLLALAARAGWHDIDIMHDYKALNLPLQTFGLKSSWTRVYIYVCIANKCNDLIISYI